MANTAFEHSPTITIPGSGNTTDNAVVLWNGTAGNNFSNSVVIVNSGAVTGVTTLAASTSITSPIAVLTNGTNSNAITLNTGATAANYTITMPTAAPAAGKVLKTTSGSTSQLEWGDAGGGNAFTNDVTITSGNVVMATADKGIDFAVTGNSSGTMQSEVLDDYEEGIFSPTMLFGGANSGISYTEQSGSYTKIGDRVMYSLRLRVSDKGSSTGSLQIGGLPFTTGSGTRNYGSQSNIYVDKIASSGTMIAYNYTSGTVLDIRTVNTSGTNADVTNYDVTNGLTLHISGHYCTRALG